MDVDATLREIRELTAQANAAYTAGDMDTWAARSAEVKNLFEDLDGWLSKGRPLPTAWKG